MPDITEEEQGFLTKMMDRLKGTTTTTTTTTETTPKTYSQEEFDAAIAAAKAEAAKPPETPATYTQEQLDAELAKVRAEAQTPAAQQQQAEQRRQAAPTNSPERTQQQGGQGAFADRINRKNVPMEELRSELRKGTEGAIYKNWDQIVA